MWWCISLKGELSEFSSLFLERVRPHCPRLFSAQSFLNLFLSLPSWLDVVIDYCPRIYGKNWWRTSLKDCHCGEFWTHFPHLISTKYYLNFFLALPLWLIIIGNYCLSLNKNVSVEFSVAYIIGSWPFVSFFLIGVEPWWWSAKYWLLGLREITQISWLLIYESFLVKSVTLETVVCNLWKTYGWLLI